MTRNTRARRGTVLPARPALVSLSRSWARARAPAANQHQPLGDDDSAGAGAMARGAPVHLVEASQDPDRHCRSPRSYAQSETGAVSFSFTAACGDRPIAAPG